VKRGGGIVVDYSYLVDDRECLRFSSVICRKLEHRVTSSNDTGDRHRRIPVFVAPSARVRVATSSVMALVPPTEELATLWRKELFLDCRWTICANQSGVLGYVAEG
jgi:hypothetical protein